MNEEIRSAYRGAVRGRCGRCSWEALATSHPEAVEMYHDHLRADHPGTWVRA